MYGMHGVCWDRNTAERFFPALKNEFVFRTVDATKDQARQDIVGYIEGFCNPRRRHSTLDCRPPNEVH
ncbi:integrase core domain-containing protein [Rhodococcus qingshengii]|uniref:integrase core domain-containing protein n=2 Tax=Nocardiaceae TaxID=85025 RepID=UPI003365A41D